MLHGPSRTELPYTETAMLEHAGLDVDERADDPSPMLEYTTGFAAVLATSLTPATLAQKLGFTPRRVRRMIRKQSLYAMKIGGRLHVPAYQLSGHALVPNIARVNQALAHLDPVSVQRWFTTADPDLEDMTPLDWLKAGREVEAVLKVVPER